MQYETYLHMTWTKYNLQDYMKFSSTLTAQIDTVSPTPLDIDIIWYLDTSSFFLMP